MSISGFSSKRIFLIGYMGAGKSTVGSTLAEHLSYLHIDTDDAIEAFTGKSILEIFDTQGEAEFRKYEMMLFSLVSELDEVVISTGGGLPINSGVMDKMLQLGLTIYLECPVSELTKRIGSNNDRPLHDSKPKQNLVEEINERLVARKSIYQKAHITVDSQNILTAQNKILSLL